MSNDVNYATSQLVALFVHSAGFCLIRTCLNFVLLLHAVYWPQLEFRLLY